MCNNMGQRNMLFTGPMIDAEMDQQVQGHLHPEPCILYGSIPSFPQPNIHPILPAPGNRINLDFHQLPERHVALPYGMTQYDGSQHHHPTNNLDLVVPTAANPYNMYMPPSSGTRIFPVPLNYGPHDQLPFSSNHGIVDVSADSYGRSSHFMDGAGGAFKRKNAEAIPGNFQYCYASAGSSSSAAPMSARPLDSDVTLMDGASFALPEYRGNDISIVDVGTDRSVRNRPGAVGVDSGLVHNTNNLIPRNYPSQPFPTTSTSWLDQQFSTNNGDFGSLSWNQGPTLPYIHGSINGGCMEAANMGVQGYQVTANNRSSATFFHPPIPQGRPNFHLPPQPMPGMRGHNIEFQSQVATSSRRLPTNRTSRPPSVNPFQDGVEAGPRFVGPVPQPTGLRLYRPHRREVMLEATQRQRNLPHLRVLPEDGVAILEISDYHGVGDSFDHHRDMRLDIDHMSYEELLALGEQIGSVGSALSEEAILSNLKTRTFVSSASSSCLDEAASADQELNFCVVCQTDYRDKEKVGTLQCGHEYHLDCITKWLLVKNTCPICKSSALTSEKMES